LPAAQLLQSAELVCAFDSENLPTAQLLHVAELVIPVNAENLPAPQGVQELAPSDAEYPAA